MKFQVNRHAAQFGHLCAIAALLLILAGCGSALRWVPEYHVVQSGETLYSIAWYYRIDYRTLARWNGLGDGSLIRSGQKIRLTGPAAQSTVRAPGRQASSSSAAKPGQPAAGISVPADVPPPRNWLWPVGGKIVQAFGQSPRTQSGIQISGRMRQPVVAAADGVVVYAGSGLVGYGQLLIVKHNATYLSAYGHNDSLLVKEGERVRQGQQLARMGEGPGQRPLLHFEIRKNGQPVDPVRYLPAR